MKFRQKTHKKCPRCGNKCFLNQTKCEECGLIFARMQYASNKLAKKKIRKFDTDFVIYTNQYPADVSWWKIFLYCLFLGLVGGHYYYVGKYVKGGLMSASFVYLLFCAIFNDQMAGFLEAGGYVILGVYALAWIVSLSFVLAKKFKVPVLVQTPEVDINYKRKELDEPSGDAKSEVKKNKSNSTKKKEKDISSNEKKAKK